MAETPSAGLAQFDALVAEVMAERRIPGLAMAVVRGSEPPLLRCWGVCDIETGVPVTPDTIFPICSVTKSFTATALALLVDEGRLDWDAPLRALLPEFRLRDTLATEQANLRDLLTHRTGLPRHDWVHMGGALDNAGMLAALRHLEPSKPFRSAWQYNNLMYVVAGLVVERVSGERWDDFVRNRLLLPLGMGRATTSLEDMLARHPDCAMPYAVVEGEQRPVPVRPIKARPAGGICASIAQMAEYIRFHLDPIPGRNGLRLSPAAAAELTAPQIHAGPSDFFEIGPVHYGFGFFVWHYRGARCVGHGGGPWSGYNCDLCLLPDQGGGVIVLTNGHDPGCVPLTWTVLDDLLWLEPLPWLDRFRSIRAMADNAAPERRSASARVHHQNTRPNRALSEYAHEYAHPAGGTVRITTDGDGLRWRGIGLDLPMAHRQGDVFEILAETASWFANRPVQFARAVEGDIESLAVPLEPEVAPIVFDRLPKAGLANCEAVAGGIPPAA
jgi:CubicO group peptidase (beta-lactamase class C family)